MLDWEEKYEEYKIGLLDDKIEKLREKVESKKATKDEYKELKKCEREKESIKARPHQLENISEYKNKLEVFLDSVDAELERRENLKNINKEIKQLNDKMEEIQEECMEIEKQLKDSNLKGEDRKELEDEKQKLLSDKKENNIKFIEKQEELKGFLNTKSELSNKSNRELYDLALNVSSRISKCNIIGSNLISGKSWDNIEYRLDNLKEKTKYTRRETAKKIKVEKPQNIINSKKAENQDINNTEPKEESKDDFTDEDIEKMGEAIKKDVDNLKGKGTNNLPYYNNNYKRSFRYRHPIVAKLMDLFKAINDRVKLGNKDYKRYQEYNSEHERLKKIQDEIYAKSIKGTDVDEKDEKKKKSSDISKQENIEKVSEKDLGLDKDFRAQIRELAEKGMEGLSEKAAKRKAAEEKLAKFRASNREEEARKFGAEYAKQSNFRQKEDDDEREQ